MQQPLRIGEITSRTGRSIHTIRWYETQGLIPDVARDSGGRRVYSEHHIRWLDLMERLGRTGMSIAQMREYTTLAKQGGAMLEQRRLCSRDTRFVCVKTSSAGPRRSR
jgi:DNA-binding transcriptional MerR regulator